MALAANQCVVCCHESSTWSIGSCDHPICLTCSVRLRVLCDTSACPVCRVDLKEVVVTKDIKPFGDLVLDPQRTRERKFGFVFQSHALRDQYDDLRSNRCPKCLPHQEAGPFRNFDELREHSRRVHGLYYCDICVGNLKLFPVEHKAYTRQELTTHRREGDLGDSSHKGHPLCEFCDDRFLDNDALHQHLRCDHQWCHVCEGLGKGQNYYTNGTALRQHFRAEHFLCEEGACRSVKNTSVFATKIDFQAHKAAVHSGGMSKAEVKQLRQVEVQFTYNRRGSGAEREEVVSQRGPPRSRVEEREREKSELLTAIRASRNTASEESKRLSPTFQSRGCVKSADQGTASKGPEKRSVTGAEVVESADKKIGFLEVRSEESNVPTSCTDVSSVGAEATVNEGMKVSKVRKPPGFDEAAPLYEPSVTPQSATSAQRTTLPVLRSTPPTKDEWPSLSTTGQFEEPRTKGSSASLLLPTPPPPPGFHQPNVKFSSMSVIKKVQASVQSKEDYEKFRALSGQFASNQISVEKYHKLCLRLFDECVWNNLGPELARTLPNESKQKELLAVFSSTASSDSSTNHRHKSPRDMPHSQGGGAWRSQGIRDLCNSKEFPPLAETAHLPDCPQPMPGWSSRVMGTAT